MAGVNFGGNRLAGTIQVDAALLAGFKVRRDAPHQRRQVHAPLPELGAPAVELGEVQQFVDEKQEPGRVPQASLDHLHAFGGRRGVLEGLERAQAQSQRGAEFVADVGEELTF